MNASALACLRDAVSPEEWQARVELAACWAADQFLINPHGLFFEEITASSLVKVDHDGRLPGYDA